jgi:hypothetical protein
MGEAPWRYDLEAVHLFVGSEHVEFPAAEFSEVKDPAIGGLEPVGVHLASFGAVIYLRIGAGDGENHSHDYLIRGGKIVYREVFGQDWSPVGGYAEEDRMARDIFKRVFPAEAAHLRADAP